MADWRKPLGHNVAIQYANMSTWYYFNRPSRLAFHNLTTRQKPPKNLRSLLGLGLKFVPNQRYTPSWMQLQPTTWTRFERDIQIKVFMAGHEDDNNDDYNPKMYVCLTWLPPDSCFPFPCELPRRLKAFNQALEKAF